jgi:hypothetical protein
LSTRVCGPLPAEYPRLIDSRSVYRLYSSQDYVLARIPGFPWHPARVDQYDGKHFRVEFVYDLMVGQERVEAQAKHNAIGDQINVVKGKPRNKSTQGTMYRYHPRTLRPHLLLKMSLFMYV